MHLPRRHTEMCSVMEKLELVSPTGLSETFQEIYSLQQLNVHNINNSPKNTSVFIKNMFLSKNICLKKCFQG